jgi:hypothetical protein
MLALVSRDRHADAISRSEANAGGVALEHTESPRLGEFEEALIPQDIRRRAGRFQLLAIVID